MLAVTLTIGTLVSVMFFFVGGVVGWLAKEHVVTTQPVYTHPCLLYTSPSPRDLSTSRMPSSA